MEITVIALLILVGVILMLAEIFLLPGITVAAIGSIIAFMFSLYYAYQDFGIQGFMITLLVSAILLLIMFYLSVRKKNLSRMSLKETISSKVSENADEKISIGEQGYTKTRLNPMGSVVLGGEIYEAKSFEGFIDNSTAVEVIAFDSSIVIVKKITK